MIEDNSLVYCRICDRWFYTQLNHHHFHHSFEYFLKVASVNPEGFHLEMSYNRREFHIGMLPRAYGGKAWGRYRHQILGEHSRKADYPNLSAAIEAMMRFLSKESDYD